MRAFADYADAIPCHWTARHVDEWLGDLRAVRNAKRSTLRNSQEAVELFCASLIDPAYQWATVCEQRFDTHPVQVVHEWNTAEHIDEAESDSGKRAFTARIWSRCSTMPTSRWCASARPGATAGCQHSAMPRCRKRHAFGLRRNEIRMLKTADFGRNPDNLEFGAVYVRRGKAKKGSTPKRRNVLAIWDWSTEVLAESIEEYRPVFPTAGSPACWPSERGPRIGLSTLNTRLAAYRDELGLDPALTYTHCGEATSTWGSPKAG